MTNEKVRDLLAMIEVISPNELKVNSWWGTFVNDYKEALQMAIKALEQQPCEDAVSRQAVHDLIAELLSDYLHDEDREKIEKLDVKIEDLKPVTPKEKTGVWVPTDEEPHEDYECNICGYVVSTFTANIEPHTEYKYCPNCGARMVSKWK